MTTPETEFGAGDIDSVAMSLLEPEPEENTQAPAADDAAQADPTEEAPDAADEAEASPDDDGGSTAEDDDTADAGDGQTAPQKFVVKVNGSEQEVTLDDLKRSFAGQGYIQQRMQEVAAIRKESEANLEALNHERAQLMEALSVQQRMLSAALPQPPSKELLKTDPIRYLEEEAAYRDQVAQRQQLAQQQAFVAQRQSEQQRIAQQSYLQQQAQLLTERIPEFSDAKKAGALKQALVAVGTQYGFAPEEVQAVSDHRYVQVLHDAMRYRELMASRERVQDRVAQVNRPVVRPGAKRPEGDGKRTVEQKVRSRMQSTGSVDDVAAFLLKG